MTKGHIFRSGPGLLPAYFLCFALLYPVLAQQQPKPEPRVEVSKTELGRDANLTCKATPAGVNLQWQFEDKPVVSSDRIKISTTTKRNEHAIDGWKESTLFISKTRRSDAGYYTCVASYSGVNSTDVRYLDLRYPARFVFDNVTSTNIKGNLPLVVFGDPTVELVSVLGISRTQIYVNWTVNPANSEISHYFLWYYMNRTENENWNIGPKIDPNATSAVLVNLSPNTTYYIKLEVQTNQSDNKNKPSIAKTTTLIEDPVFVPNISINGFSATSVTIGWQAPPKEIERYIHYYLLEARKKDGGAPRKAYHSRDCRNLPYMFDNLEPHSTYIFKVRACQDFTKECGNWSEEMEAATLDGVPGRPSDVTVNCSASHMLLTWAAPKEPNAEIKGYTIELTGTAEYKDRNGIPIKEIWGPLFRFYSSDSYSARFEDLQPNTMYTVRVNAMTRTRRRGEEVVRNCTTARAPPDHPPHGLAHEGDYSRFSMKDSTPQANFVSWLK